MAIPIVSDWRNYFADEDEGLGSSYERVIINNLLSEICREFEVREVLEAPVFGFTGLSGINSMNLALEGKDVTLVDNNSERLVMIEKKWQECKLPVNLRYSEDFTSLPFDDKQFDMSWNFSSLWFVKDLRLFLSELSRVTRKVLLINVPNRTGLGFLLQWITSTKEQKEELNPSWIKHRVFLPILEELGWQEVANGYIDCPPWPDIGMKKEDFAKKLYLSFLLDRDEKQEYQHTIMNYYRGHDRDLPKKLMKYSKFERKLPNIFKHIWAHHQYHVFVRPEYRKSKDNNNNLIE